MNTLGRQTGNERGSAMLSAMYCVCVVSLAIIGLATLMGQDTHQSKLLEQRSQASLVAEGAADYFIARIADDLDLLYAPTMDMLAGQIGLGQYEIDIIRTGPEAYCLTSKGIVGPTSQTVKAHLQITDPYIAFRKAIFCDNNIDGGGNGKVVNSTHSNSSSTYYGNCQVDGKVDSVGVSEVQGNCVVTATVNSDVPPLNFPKLDLGYYYNIAATNGQVHSGDTTLKGDYAPAGGVMWVDGNVTISSKTTFTGCLIATGSITQSGQYTQQQVGTFPALVSRDGDIGLWGGTVINGAIYTQSGFVNVFGGTDMNGTIVSWGGVNLNGNWGVIDHKEERPEVLEMTRIDLVAWES